MFFQKDEVSRTVDPNWSREDLLAQSGIFFLKDITHLIGYDPPGVIQRHAKALEDKKRGSAYRIMGMQMPFNQWVVRMTTFAPYYRRNLEPEHKILTASTLDELVKSGKEGPFLLADICTLIPFAVNQMRYRAKRYPGINMGVYQGVRTTSWLVRMPEFGNWLRKQIATDFGRKEEE